MNAPLHPGIQLPTGELIALAAVDNGLYARTFFPQTARQEDPPYFAAVWSALESPEDRFVNIRIFRDGAKTSLLRLFTAKRIGYALSRTILYISASEPHAVQSIQWLRSRIEAKTGADGSEQRSLFASTFDLRRGRKWTDTEIEVHHGTDERAIWVLGVGITSDRLRGINFDDYRPDLIIIDDIVTDENATTQMQREKVETLVLGAIKNSLAPRSEEPNAKMVMLSTPIHKHDVGSKAMADPEWRSIIVPCWTPETMDLPVEQQVSVWPARHPTLEQRSEKLSAIKRNKLSIFLREKECRLADPESRAFKADWLQFYEGDPPSGGTYVSAVDPIPPPSETALARNADTDYEAHTVWCRAKGNYYLVELRVMRRHEPDWSVKTALELAQKYRVTRIAVESVLYQRVLKWHLEQEMARRRTYFIVKPVVDKRSKYNRITGTMAGLASQGMLYVKLAHTQFITQFEEYPSADHDDVLDSSAIALEELVAPYLENEDMDDDFTPDFDDADIPRIRQQRRCP